MILESIELKNFRLHKNSSINFSDKLNFIIGGNGQGKTSILESIYFLCTTKSLNQVLDSEVVSFNENEFEIKGKFQDTTNNNVRLYYSLDSNKKHYFIDGKQVHRASSVIGKFPVVSLTPSDHALTLGSPAERRKFVDSVISQASATYLKILLEYNKTLRQRSSLLSQIKEQRSSKLFDQLDAWTEALISNGSEIIKHRISFVKEFNSYVARAYKNIMNEQEFPFISYKYLNNTDKETEINKKFAAELENKKNDELRRATNLVGPHRDDLLFSVNEFELKKYGSQGQHKTFQIALRFGQFFYLKDALSKTPVFLLDDVFGELDSFRAGKISEYLNDVGQAFITMTDFTKLEKLKKTEADYILNINNGMVSYG